jgi:hypothetical protein
MSQGILGDRGKALEDSFFARESEAALTRLRTERDEGEARDRLALVAGLHDEEVLDRLLALDVGAEAWVALTLVPLIEVAWADGRIDPEERDAILTAAHADGVVRSTPAHAMLQGWLATRPGPELLGSWEAMTRALSEEFIGAERNALEDEVMGRARRVAEATGGYLGFGDKVCIEERSVMERLEKAFR